MKLSRRSFLFLRVKMDPRTCDEQSPIFHRFAEETLAHLHKQDALALTWPPCFPSKEYQNTMHVRYLNEFKKRQSGLTIACKSFDKSDAQRSPASHKSVNMNLVDCFNCTPVIRLKYLLTKHSSACPNRFLMLGILFSMMSIVPCKHSMKAFNLR